MAAQKNINPEWLIERKIVTVDNNNHSNNNIIKSTSRHTYVAQKTKTSIHSVAKADTSASKHYFAPRDKRTLWHIKKLTSSPNIHLPNNETIQATEIGKLHIHSSLTELASQVQILPQLKNSLLVSIGQLCDDNCIAIFDKKTSTYF